MNEIQKSNSNLMMSQIFDDISGLITVAKYKCTSKFEFRNGVIILENWKKN